MKVFEVICINENAYPAAVSADWIVNYVAEMNDREDAYEGEVPEHINEFPRYVLRNVPIGDINIGDFSYDPALAAEYAKGQRETVPPIVYDPVNHQIIDGFHRAHAARLRGDTHISAYVGVR